MCPPLCPAPIGDARLVPPDHRRPPFADSHGPRKSPYHPFIAPSSVPSRQWRHLSARQRIEVAFHYVKRKRLAGERDSTQCLSARNLPPARDRGARLFSCAPEASTAGGRYAAHVCGLTRAIEPVIGFVFALGWTTPSCRRDAGTTLVPFELHRTRVYTALALFAFL